MHINIINEDNYSAEYTDPKTGFKTGYYTRKQMAALYPKGGYKVAGAIGQTAIKENGPTEEDDLVEVADVTGIRARVARGHYRPTPATAVVGYVRVKDDVFLAVVKNVLPKRVGLGVLAAALLAVGVFCAVNWNTWFPRQLDIDPNVVNLVSDTTETRDTIQAPGCAYVDVDAQTGQMQRAFENPAGNPCFFQIVIELDDTGKTVYTSKLIPPSSKLVTPSLDKTLSPGTYPATIHYRTYSIENQQAMNMVDCKTELRVK